MLISQSSDGGCGGPITTYSGWYTKLYYTGANGFNAYDALAADVHTAPTDEAGNKFGWVSHVGLGNVEMAIINPELPDDNRQLSLVTVYRFHELVTTNFQRLSDEEWKTIYAQSPPPRPSFGIYYLANKFGETTGEVVSLLTGVHNAADNQQPTSFVLEQNYPNPFNSSTIISMTIPPSLAHTIVSVKIYNVTGQLLCDLIERELPSGSFAVRWDGTTSTNISAASGVYFYHVSVGKYKGIGKMFLLR